MAEDWRKHSDDIPPRPASKLLKDLLCQIQSLKKENLSLLSESHYDIDNSRKYVRYTAEQIEALEKVYVECPSQVP
ncbi:homeobox-leucine zipper protein REVOLUTA [Trifolium repens]|nr:homeobox-leucine zipper protein REVOLUTA [Trifolium repens]